MSCTAPHLPRDAWAEHPRYPSQVLLLGSHANFRRASGLVTQRARAATDALEAEYLFARWMASMRSHEAYEEHKLYPFLAARFCVDTGAARRGHAELHEAEAEVRRAFELQRRAPTDAGRAQLVGALSEHGRRLDAHLELEEELVIPLLLALTPNEFAEYYDAPIDHLRATLPRPC